MLKLPEPVLVNILTPAKVPLFNRAMLGDEPELPVTLASKIKGVAKPAIERNMLSVAAVVDTAILPVACVTDAEPAVV